MTDEEVNRKFDIVAAHLASLAVRQEKHQEAQERAEARLGRAETRLDRVERVLGAAIRLGARQMREMREGMRETDERINALIASQERVTESIARLVEAQARTDAKLAERNGRRNDSKKEVDGGGESGARDDDE